MNKQLVHSKFEDIALSYPGHVAIEHAGKEITYAQLNADANQLAHALLAAGFSKGSIAGAFFESSPEYVASIIGINKAGLAFMPLDPGFPQKRLIHLLNSAQPVVLITKEDLLPTVAGLLADREITAPAITVIAVRCAKHAMDIAFHNPDARLHYRHDHPASNPDLPLDGNDPNYIIYTSGSTGQPKLIEGCHKGLSHFIHWEIAEFHLNSNSRVSQLSPLSFDVSFRDIFAPLLAGGTLCIPEKNIRFQPQRLLQWIVSSGVTLVHSVPTLFRLLTGELGSLAEPADALKELQYILLAGEPLFGKDVLRWRSLAGAGVRLVNMYGPSETTLAKMFYCVPDNGINPASVIPLGQPISNTAILILNEGRLCRPGEPGTIYIKTPFRSRGYFRNPELTAEKFVQNPLHNDFNDIVYNTGDTGKYLEDTNVVFLGRNDNQVKIRGNRIELLEVEKVLSAYPGIKEVILTVVAQEEEDDAVLACYYTGEQLDESRIKDYLSRHLLQYMHPSFYIHLHEFPLNSSGKIDRRSLPKPERPKAESFEAPIGELENKLAAIWMDILKQPRISRSDSFFNIGGSSLKGIKIISKIYKECKVMMKLPDLFAHPTIRQLAAFLGGSDQNGYENIGILPEKPFYDLSHAQKRLWILSHFEDQHVAYNMLYANRFKGHLEYECLVRAFKTMIARHETLRTVFVLVDSEPKQRIIAAENFEFAIQTADLSGEADPEARARQIAETEWTTPFDLATGPLFRVKLLQLPGNESLFVFSIHHIISDGWSSSIWMKEIRELYDAYVHGKPNPLKPLKVQYKDFAAWQNGLLDGNKLGGLQDYWLGQFTPVAPPVELPSDKPRPKVKTYNGGHYGLRIDKPTLLGLKELSNRNDSTLFMTLLASLNVLLFRLTGTQDITIGTPITGRAHEDLEEQIGLFVNTLALRTRFDAGDSFDQLLQRVRLVATGAYEHQAYPFDYLIDQLDLDRDMSRSPLFDIMIVLHDSKAEATRQPAPMDEVAVWNYYVKPSVTKFDLNYNFTEHGDGINLELEYNKDVFSFRFIDTICSIYRHLLCSIVENAAFPVSRLPLLADNERRPLKGPAEEYLSASCPSVVHLFEAQTRATPDGIAVSSGGQQLTYTELNRQANSIARYLQSTYKVGAGDTVAILLNRSASFVAIVLGILKTGAAFVPVDTDFPYGRIESILDDLQPRLVITESRFAGDAGGRAWVDISTVEVGSDDQSRDDLPAVAGGSQLAYIIYTSGSTGKPKGVAISHAAFLNYIQWANGYYFNGKADHPFAFNTSIAFDLTLTSLFSPLLRGDKLVIFSNDLDTDEALRGIFDPASGVKAVKLTPSHLSLIGNLELERTSIDTVIVGGEMLSAHQVNILRHLNPKIRVYNEYGPTEATVGCVVREIGPGAEKITIGKPIANMAVYIGDAYGNLQPEGIPGELFLAGDGLARGYYGNPGLTAEKFIQNPFDGSYDRVYATGDIGFVNADGDIELLGRKDRQVKIRGHRIELEEIEKAMLQYPVVRESLATVTKDEEGQPHIIGYFIAQGETDLVQLRSWLKQRLPLHMIPLYFIQLDKFPLTTNGKLDVKALPDPFASTAATVSREYIPPITATEHALTAIWQSVLNKEKISITDDFFELGGHSLSAMRILTRIAKELGVRMTLKNLFTHTTIQTLAAKIDQTDTEGVNVIENEISSADEEDTFII